MEALQDLDQKVADSDRHQEDDFKFLQRNVRKLFRMCGNMRKNRANDEGSSNRVRWGGEITARREFLDLAWLSQVM
uniref:Uncharacterized protein n=1 Tax=Setaria viridis TaxID=4556 RepID=A0A4U6VC01_SETVI|nr:hypothetical protein SEVIR_4G123100v2 [Setaria viridis]